MHESKFGLQKNQSAQHSLIEIVGQIRSCIENKKFGCAKFIDLKKAFDTVNHYILLQTLQHYEIRRTTISWFHSYLKTVHNMFLVITFLQKLNL